MASRLALGRSTKASARLEALRRVMRRLSSMPDLERGRRVFPDWRQAAGFTERRIARELLGVVTAAFFAEPRALGGMAGGGWFRRVDGFRRPRQRVAPAPLAREINRQKQNQGQDRGGAQDQQQILERQPEEQTGLFRRHALLEGGGLRQHHDRFVRA